MGLDIQVIISGLVSAVVSGVFVSFLSYKISQKLKTAEEAAKARRATTTERAYITNELQDALCVWASQVERAIEPGQTNNDLHASYEALRTVACKKQTLDRNIVVDAEKGE